MMDEVSKEKELGTFHGSMKGLNGEEKGESKEHGKEKNNEHKEDNKNERQRRESKTQSKGLKQKEDLAGSETLKGDLGFLPVQKEGNREKRLRSEGPGTILNVLMRKELETPDKSKNLKDKEDVKETVNGKIQQNEKGMNKKGREHFKDNPKEKRVSTTKSSALKKETFGSKTFKDDPEDQDFHTIQEQGKSRKRSRAEDAKEVAGIMINKVVKEKELEHVHGSKSLNEKEEKLKNLAHEKEKPNEIKKKNGNDKEKRKSKTKSKELEQKDFGPETLQEEPEDLALLPVQKDGKREKRPRSDDEKEDCGTISSEVFMKKKLEIPHESKNLTDEEEQVNGKGKIKQKAKEMSNKNEGERINKNPKEKRKSKTTSLGLKMEVFDRSKTFKEEPEDQDFLTISTEEKSRKRLRAEDAEEALGKKKKMKTEKTQHEIQPINEQSEEEIQPKKGKKEKNKHEMEPKKEMNEEGIQEPTKKKTKEERDSAAALKVKKKEEEEQQRWRWWEEQKYEDGVNWMFLEHKGPVFAPPYEPLPDNVKFYYDGKPLKLSSEVEEVASFFAKMLDHDYTTKAVFRKNFFMDWRKEMTLEERMVIADLDKCDFTEMFTYYKGKMEEKKNISKEQKLINKEANEKAILEFGFCIMDHHRERIGNFKVEPPGLFRGRGDHPKQGMLKKRILPEDVILNCSKDSKIPEPPLGHKWKEVRHDNTVTWLASWTEHVQGSLKYVMLNANSRLKGEKDWEKYEVARKLKVCVDRIRAQYRDDWKSKEMKSRQCAVALYFIDKLALRAGNEKEEGETADTVGCCSLRVEHIKLYPEVDGEKHVVEFDFLGKDSIRYYNKVPVEKKVFKNLQLFLENKQEGDDLFDRLSTPMLNKHLQSLMEGLTAKVFRTYNASITLQQQLKELTNPDESIPAKILSYNRANRAVAILCNHQRAAPKTFEQSMANLQTKIKAKKEQVSLSKTELKQAKMDAKSSESEKLNNLMERKKKAVQRAEDQLMKLEVQATDREENKQIALGTSKLNYLDPRISVTWCQKWGVALEKIYNKTQRDKFAWAINMSDIHFEF